ncbi:TIR domain-containing protein [Photobacterium damselae]
MTISSATSTIIRLTKELANLTHKVSLESRKEADLKSKIAQVQRGINKNTSASMLKSKMADIARKESDISNVQTKKADLLKKALDVEGKLLKAKQDLVKKEEQEAKKKQQALEREQKRQAETERRIQREKITHQKQLQAEISRTLKLSAQAESLPSSSPTEGEKEAEYDLFISHASEDKEEFVRPLAETLEYMGVRVWYDEFALKVGDSLRKSIDKGLVNSKYGTVIISSSFCSKNWTQYELDSMVAREMHGHKMILPIWHKVTKDDVINFSPSLADKVALNTSISSIEEIANSLREVVMETEA